MWKLNEFAEFAKNSGILYNQKRQFVRCKESINSYIISYKLKFKNNILIKVSLKEVKFFKLTSFPKSLVSKALKHTGDYFIYKSASNFVWKNELLNSYPNLIYDNLQVRLGQITQKFMKLLRKIRELLDDCSADANNGNSNRNNDEFEILKFPPAIKIDAKKFQELFHKDPPVNFIENIVLIKEKAHHIYTVKCFYIFNEIRKVFIGIGDYKRVCEEINAQGIGEFYNKLYFIQLKLCVLNDFAREEGPAKMPLQFGEEYSERCFAAIDPGIFALSMKDFQEL
ncbi:unnamed protein product [Blepharisma stoltei]|uniref:Uncharacterized protein n=1 Tax=Blepharisma stoltei TaxID=1481888 RepID=A0AAU9K898_9CILI|nr:unnamed protein product [Blepharisma stoltei]